MIRGLFFTFPNPVSNSLLVLYMIKPLLVFFIAKFNKVHWERVFYSKTVFAYRLLIDLFIFIWAQYKYDEARFGNTDTPNINEEYWEFDVFQFIVIISPILVGEVIIYYKCVKPNNLRTMKI